MVSSGSLLISLINSAMEDFFEKMVGIIVLQIVLIILNAIFSSAEISVISMNETKIKQMAEEKIKKGAPES